MISFILSNFEMILKDIWLYRAIRNVQYSLPYSAYYLFSILERCTTQSKTFFTPIGELGFALYEMFEVSLLSIEKLPNEEIAPTTEELQRIKCQDPQVHETYWEVMCCFYICQEVSDTRHRGVAKNCRLTTVSKM